MTCGQQQQRAEKDVTMSDEHDADKRLKIVLINCRRSFCVEVYYDFARENGVDLLILLECLQKARRQQAANIYADVEGTQVTVAVVNRNLQYKAKYVDTHQVEVSLTQPGITLAAWYVPPAATITEHAVIVDRLANALKRNRTRMIHAGDFNAHHIITGDRLQDARGKRLAEAIAAGSFQLLNEIGVPTIAVHRTTPDWAVASGDIANKCKWSAQPDIHASDHEMITIVIDESVSANGPETTTTIRPAAFLRSILALNRNANLEQWHTNKQRAVEAATRLSKSRRRQKPEELVRLDKEIRQLSKNIGTARGALDHLRPLLDEKKENRKRLSTTLEWKMTNDKFSRATAANLHKTVAKTQKTKKVTTIAAGNTLLNGEEAARYALEQFYPEQTTSAPRRTVNRPSNMYRKVVRAEIEAALTTAKVSSAPGSDGISHGLLKQWAKKDMAYFVALFDSWLRAGNFPSELKCSNVILLAKKAGKAAEISNTRPISLLDSMGKLFERVIDNRLMHEVESRNLLSTAQFGYRGGKRLEQALLLLDAATKRACAAEKREIVVQLDISGAFNNVLHQAIVDELERMEIDTYVIDIIADYLTDRKATMTLEGETVSIEQKRGAPQGSVLGPHLFIIAVNRAIAAAERQCIGTDETVVAFADDIALSIAACGTEEALKRCETIILSIEAELDRIGLKLAIDKTKVVMMMQEPAGVIITLAGQDIRTVDSTTVLGVERDWRGKYDRHVEKATKKLDNKIRSLHQPLALSSALSVPLRRMLVESHVETPLKYAASVWYTRREHEDSKLKAAEAKVSKAIVMADAKASRVSANLLAKRLPLRHVCSLKAAVDKHIIAGSCGGRRLERKMTIADRLHPSEWQTLKIDAEINTAEDDSRVTATARYYTDGSKTQTSDCKVAKTGAAFLRVHTTRPLTGKLLKLKPWNTVFQAEAVAIREALSMAASDRCDESIAIISDSLSALKAITNPVTHNPIIGECQALISEIKRQRREVTLNWIKGHNGLRWNETADEMAKKAADAGNTVVLPCPVSHCKRKHFEEQLDTYDEEYRRDRFGNEIKKFFSGPKDPRLKNVTVNRCTTQIYTGHGHNLESFRYGYGGAGEPCPCGAKQTTGHSISSCSTYMEGNVQAAAQVGLPIDILIGDWDQLVSHAKFHKYIAARAPTLYREQQRDNARFANQRGSRLNQQEVDSSAGGSGTQSLSGSHDPAQGN